MLPPSPRRSTIETFHGVAVDDPYRWLENSADPEVGAWIAAQNALTRGILDGWPGRTALRDRVAELMTFGSVSYSALRAAGTSLFAIKREPPREQPMLVAMALDADPAHERILVDPNALDPTGRTSIDWYVPSPDGSKVALSLSSAGTESGDVHVFDVASSKPVGRPVPRVNGGTAGGSLAWDGSGTAFYYTRYPRAGEVPPREMGFHVRIHRHVLGDDPAVDAYELGKEFPHIAEIQLETCPKGSWVLASVQNGDGGEFRHWLRDPSGRWSALTGYDDRCIAARFGEESIFFVSRVDAPRGRILRLPLASASEGIAGARAIVPEAAEAIEAWFARGTGLWVGSDRIFVRYQMGGPSLVRAFALDGRSLGAIPSPAASAVDDLVVLPGGDVLIEHQGFTSPPAWYRAAAKGGEPAATGLRERSPADFDDCEVVRDVAVSPDGTRVPLTVVRRRGIALNGSHPTILYGYGGYGICQTPVFRRRLRAWIERGGVFAVAHIRGGGEFGESWHREGNLARKQNVFDDFAACARRVVAAGYTRREKLALLGVSNGGLLMGAMITQHPGLAGAVVSLVGLYDMLRVEETPNGAYNVTEFGSVKDPAMFAALYAYSPYHRVADGMRYPPVLMLTGENDPRVDPWQSRKMIARLQTADAGRAPILLRTSAGAGHGRDTPLSDQIEEYTDVLSFLILQLGA